MIVSSANNLCNYYISVDCSCQQIYEIILLYFYNWYRLEESNSYSHFRRVLYYPLYEGGMVGVRYGIRTRILKLFHRFDRIGVLIYKG